jgi:integrase
MAEGIEVRHRKECRTKAGEGRCNCRPSYRAAVYDPEAGRKVRRTFPTSKAAEGWRRDALVTLARGEQLEDTAPVSAVPSGDRTPTLADVAERWLAGARAGTIRNRSGQTYKPAAVRDYERHLRLRVLPAFGHRELESITRGELQTFVDDLLESGLSPSSVVCALLPLRAIYRRAVARDQVAHNPTRGLEMPAVERSVRVVASPGAVERLLHVLEPDDQALWSTAFYAGLRRGELTALRWEDVDLAAGLIRVRRGWDAVEGEIAPKSREGKRNVPIPAPLRDVLLEHKLRHQDDARTVVFGTLSQVLASTRRASTRWKRLGLDDVTLHHARHTYASFMIAAGVNAKALQAFMGHANIAVTFDLYGHLFPGSEAEAAGLLEAFLDRARAAGTDPVGSVADAAGPTTVPQTPAAA